MKLVISKWPFLRWLPCPIGNGGYVYKETDTHYQLIQSLNRPPSMDNRTAWVRKSWMVEG